MGKRIWSFIAVIPSCVKEIIDVNKLSLSLKLLFSGTSQNALLVNKTTLFIKQNYSKTFDAAVKSEILPEKTNLRNSLGNVKYCHAYFCKNFPLTLNFI